jgi:hypothetical protein
VSSKHSHHHLDLPWETARSRLSDLKHFQKGYESLHKQDCSCYSPIKQRIVNVIELATWGVPDMQSLLSEEISSRKSFQIKTMLCKAQHYKYTLMLDGLHALFKHSFCAPTSDPFSRTATETSRFASLASCLRRIAALKPAGPAPTMHTSNGRVSLSAAEDNGRDQEVNRRSN